MNFPGEEEEFATPAPPTPAPAPAREAARAAATTVVFPDAVLGIDLKLEAQRILLVRATDESPAAALAPGLVLRSINGAAVVGACRPRDALAISKQIRGSPRPLTLEFVEDA